MTKYFVATTIAGAVIWAISTGIKPEFPNIKEGLFVIGVTLTILGLSLGIASCVEW